MTQEMNLYAIWRKGECLSQVFAQDEFHAIFDFLEYSEEEYNSRELSAVKIIL